MTNKSITVSTTKPITESSRGTNDLITVTNQSSTVIDNESSTVTNEPCTVTNKLCTVSNKTGTVTTESSTVMEIDIEIQEVMEFDGMGNWEQVHTFAAVCKLWSHCCLPHLSNIGKVPMDGGAECRLNIVL